MREKGLWLILACLISMIILLSACGARETTISSDSAVSSEKPQYGGILEALYGQSIGVFDPAEQGVYMGPVGAMIFEQFLAAKLGDLCVIEIYLSPRWLDQTQDQATGSGFATA